MIHFHFPKSARYLHFGERRLLHEHEETFEDRVMKNDVAEMDNAKETLGGLVKKYLQQTEIGQKDVDKFAQQTNVFIERLDDVYSRDDKNKLRAMLPKTPEEMIDFSVKLNFINASDVLILRPKVVPAPAPAPAPDPAPKPAVPAVPAKNIVKKAAPLKKTVVVKKTTKKTVTTKVDSPAVKKERVPKTPLTKEQKAETIFQNIMQKRKERDKLSFQVRRDRTKRPALQKVNEEIAKLGSEFSELTGGKKYQMEIRERAEDGTVIFKDKETGKILGSYDTKTGNSISRIPRPEMDKIIDGRKWKGIAILEIDGKAYLRADDFEPEHSPAQSRSAEPDDNEKMRRYLARPGMQNDSATNAMRSAHQIRMADRIDRANTDIRQISNLPALPKRRPRADITSPERSAAGMREPEEDTFVSNTPARPRNRAERDLAGPREKVIPPGMTAPQYDVYNVYWKLWSRMKGRNQVKTAFDPVDKTQVIIATTNFWNGYRIDKDGKKVHMKPDEVKEFFGEKAKPGEKREAKQLDALSPAQQKALDADYLPANKWNLLGKNKKGEAYVKLDDKKNLIIALQNPAMGVLVGPDGKVVRNLAKQEIDGYFVPKVNNVPAAPRRAAERKNQAADIPLDPPMLDILDFSSFEPGVRKISIGRAGKSAVIEVPAMKDGQMIENKDVGFRMTKNGDGTFNLVALYKGEYRISQMQFDEYKFFKSFRAQNSVPAGEQPVPPELEAGAEEILNNEAKIPPANKEKVDPALEKKADDIVNQPVPAKNEALEKKTEPAESKDAMKNRVLEGVGKNEKIFTEIQKAYPDIVNDTDWIKSILQKNPMTLQYMPDAVKNDAAILAVALEKDPLAIKHVPVTVKDYDLYVTRAVLKEVIALNELPDALIAEMPEWLMDIVKNPLILNQIKADKKNFHKGYIEKLGLENVPDVPLEEEVIIAKKPAAPKVPPVKIKSKEQEAKEINEDPVIAQSDMAEALPTPQDVAAYNAKTRPQKWEFVKAFRRNLAEKDAKNLKEYTDLNEKIIVLQREMYQKELKGDDVREDIKELKKIQDNADFLLRTSAVYLYKTFALNMNKRNELKREDLKHIAWHVSKDALDRSDYSTDPIEKGTIVRRKDDTKEGGYAYFCVVDPETKQALPIFLEKEETETEPPLQVAEVPVPEQKNPEVVTDAEKPAAKSDVAPAKPDLQTDEKVPEKQSIAPSTSKQEESAVEQKKAEGESKPTVESPAPAQENEINPNPEKTTVAPNENSVQQPATPPAKEGEVDPNLEKEVEKILAPENDLVVTKNEKTELNTADKQAVWYMLNHARDNNLYNSVFLSRRESDAMESAESYYLLSSNKDTYKYKDEVISGAKKVYAILPVLTWMKPGASPAWLKESIQNGRTSIDDVKKVAMFKGKNGEELKTFMSDFYKNVLGRDAKPEELETKAESPELILHKQNMKVMHDRAENSRFIVERTGDHLAENNMIVSMTQERSALLAKEGDVLTFNEMYLDGDNKNILQRSIKMRAAIPSWKKPALDAPTRAEEQARLAEIDAVLNKLGPDGQRLLRTQEQVLKQENERQGRENKMIAGHKIIQVPVYDAEGNPVIGPDGKQEMQERDVFGSPFTNEEKEERKSRLELENTIVRDHVDYAFASGLVSVGKMFSLNELQTLQNYAQEPSMFAPDDVRTLVERIKKYTPIHFWMSQYDSANDSWKPREENKPTSAQKTDMDKRLLRALQTNAITRKDIQDYLQELNPRSTEGQSLAFSQTILKQVGFALPNEPAQLAQNE